MGYELIIKYHPRGEEGFDLSETEEKKKRVGKAMDPQDDMKLAKEVLKQFSRRDVLVTDIEVIEFVRKPLSVKTAKNGSVIIRGKKYSVNEIDPASIGEDEPEEAQEATAASNDTPKASPTTQPNPTPPTPPKNPTQGRKVIKREVYEPEAHLTSLFAAEGFKVGEIYDILDTVETGIDPFKKVDYVLISPKRGVEVRVPDSFFTAPAKGLNWDNVTEDVDPSDGVDLDFGGTVNMPMPNLRG